MDNIRCNGDEYDLYGCEFDREHNCGSSEHVGVVCEGEYANTTEPAYDYNTIENGEFRLVLQPYADDYYTGRAENWYNGAWGTICDDSFDNNNN